MAPLFPLSLPYTAGHRNVFVAVHVPYTYHKKHRHKKHKHHHHHHTKHSSPSTEQPDQDGMDFSGCMYVYVNIHKVMKGSLRKKISGCCYCKVICITNLHTVIVWSFCTMDNLKYDRQSFSSLSFPVQLLHRFLGENCVHINL